MCKCQQVSVCELFIALQAGFHPFHCRGNLKAVRPEFVTRMSEIFVEERECFARRQRVSRKGGIRDDTDESELGQRARRPPRIDTTTKPTMRYVMVFVRRPEERRQDIEVKERRFHGSSARSSSTRAAVIFGDRRLRRRTRRPLRSSVTSGRSAALLTNSLTASPRVSRCRSACALATLIASSLSCSVVLGTSESYHEYDALILLLASPR
jgi:hypothetical protein